MATNTATAPRYSATLRRVAKYLATASSDPTLLLKQLAWAERMSDAGNGENFELGQALHWWASENYAGHWCGWYAVLCVLCYTPGSMERGSDQTLYAQIVASVERRAQ